MPVWVARRRGGRGGAGGTQEPVQRARSGRLRRRPSADLTGYVGSFQNFVPPLTAGVPSELAAPERLAATAPVVATAPRLPASTLSGTGGRGTVKRVPARRAWVQGGRARSHKRPADAAYKKSGVHRTVRLYWTGTILSRNT
eukprot:COSAG04_NODE_2825_length_3532_cov_1.454413_6_plen_142_part_00